MTRFSLNSNVLSDTRIFAIILWVLYFCFAISAALIFQLLLMPHMPFMHAPGTKLSNDSNYFDLIAWNMAQQIHLHGWSSWQLFPSNSASGSVAILAVLYAVFGHDPTLAIPLNALFHSLGGVLLFMLAIELAPNKLTGMYAGLLASFLFVVFPSALNWYGQILKDQFAISGILALLLVWLKAFKLRQSVDRPWLGLACANIACLFFLAALRPYYLKPLFVVILALLLVMLLQRVIAKKATPWLFFLMVLISLLAMQRLIISVGASEGLRGEGYSDWNAKYEDKYLSTSEAQNHLVEIAKDGERPLWEWRKSAWMPEAAESMFEMAAKTRVALALFGKTVNAHSMIDEDILPQNDGELLAYLPRAFQIALLAPFPSSWGDHPSPARLVSFAEMSVIYLCLAGLFFLLRFHRTPQVWFAIFFSSTFLMVYGVTVVNLGTLYRIRYGFEFIFVLLGIVGWAIFFARKGYIERWSARIKSLGTVNINAQIPLENKTAIDRQSVVGAGVIVITMTFFGFLGFFIRDVMMAHTFGLGMNLDDFFMALMIPMFIVTVFCVSLGSAFVPYYTSMEQQLPPTQLRAIISHLSALVLTVSLVVCVLLHFVAPYVLIKLHMVTAADNLPALLHLMDMALPILWFSGVVILGNSTLNATRRFTLPSMAQLVVPVLAILALLLFGQQYGVIAVIVGMVVGQLLNLLIVQMSLARSGISLIPKYQPHLTPAIRPLWQQYVPLLASAFFVSISLPIDTMLAATLPTGNVSAFNLGTKVVLFISGLLGTAISSVMLPYFSMLIEKEGLQKARGELSLFLLMATFISVIASALLYIFSGPIVHLLFARGTFGNQDVMAVSRVMQYVVIQIPFFVCNMLLLKYATATRHTFTITLSALIGLALNVGLSLILMPHMGASGIALAASFSMLVSSSLLILALVRFGHIRILDAIVILLNWMLFLALLVSEHFRVTSSIAIVIATYVILLMGYVNLINKKRELFA